MKELSTFCLHAGFIRFGLASGIQGRCGGGGIATVKIQVKGHKIIFDLVETSRRLYVPDKLSSKNVSNFGVPFGSL